MLIFEKKIRISDRISDLEFARSQDTFQITATCDDQW